MITESEVKNKQTGNQFYLLFWWQVVVLFSLLIPRGIENTSVFLLKMRSKDLDTFNKFEEF